MNPSTIVAALASLAFAVLFGSSARAETPRTYTVRRIELDGKDVETERRASSLVASIGPDLHGRARVNDDVERQQLGRTPEALSAYDDALALFRAAGDRNDEAETLGRLATLQLATNRPAAAADSSRKALEIFRRLGARNAEAEALLTLAQARAALGDQAAASATLLEAKSLFVAVGDRDGEARALFAIGNASVMANVGIVRAGLGHHGHALQAYRDAAALFRQVGDRDGEARSDDNAGGEPEQSGDLDGALSAYREAVIPLAAIGETSATARAAQATPYGGIAPLESRLP